VTLRPTRATTDGRAYLDLRAAGKKIGRSTDELHTFYALEGFLARLAESTYASQFALKGGMLLPVYDSRRPTRDIDLHGVAISNDIDHLSTVVTTIAAIALDDGLIFDIVNIRAQPIRDSNEDLYSGVRVHLSAQLATANPAIHIDISLGDHVEPAPDLVTVPRLLDYSPRIQILGYPLAMVHAEKILTTLDRGRANTRWRDFADLYSLSRHHDVNGHELITALAAVAGQRRITMQSLATALAGWPATVQRRWEQWRTHHNLDQLPDDFTTVCHEVFVFTDPALTGHAHSQHWKAASRNWQPVP
jgi:hypothetical protein